MPSTIPLIESAAAYPLGPEERTAYLEFACEVAALAGESILPQFRRGLAVDNKATGPGYDPVRETDRAAERAMRKAIRGRYPRHGILGEEFGVEPGDGLTWVLDPIDGLTWVLDPIDGLTWVLDPIDGTRGFVMGLLHWGTLVALFDGQRPVVGAIHQPVLGGLALRQRLGDVFPNRRAGFGYRRVDVDLDAGLGASGTGRDLQCDVRRRPIARRATGTLGSKPRVPDQCGDAALQRPPRHLFLKGCRDLADGLWGCHGLEPPLRWR